MRVIDFGQAECKKVAGLLDAFLSNELLAETSQAIAEHVENCEVCSREVKSRVELQARVKGVLGTAQSNPAIRARLQARLRQQDSVRSFRTWAVPLAVAATLLIGSFAAWKSLTASREAWRTSAEDQQTYIQALYSKAASVVRVGLGDHVHCAHFRKFADGLPTLEEIVSKLGGYEELAPIVREEVPEGFEILLAHQCKYNGRQYVHFALGRGDELLSVILTRRQGAESFERDQLVPVLQAAGAPVYAVGVDQFQVAGFDTDQYLAFVISNLPREENLQIAQALTPKLRAFLGGSAG